MIRIGRVPERDLTQFKQSVQLRTSVKVVFVLE